MSIVPKKKSGCRKFKLLQYEIQLQCDKSSVFPRTAHCNVHTCLRETINRTTKGKMASSGQELPDYWHVCPDRAGAW